VLVNPAMQWGFQSFIPPSVVEL